MYSFVRQNLESGSENRRKSFSDAGAGGENYKSYKCMYRLGLITQTTNRILQFGFTLRTS